MRQLGGPDRVGIGWRTDLAASILLHLDEIDVVEVILDDYLGASQRELRALKTLSCQVPVIYHGVTLGLASSHPIEGKRLERLARTIGVLEPEVWSEHLAFVRAGGREIGHLAAPPRTAATVEGTCENLHRVRQTVGSLPALENIASLLDPPGSRLSEGQWVSEIAAAAGTELLLDLHNLYANALNFGLSPQKSLTSFPLERVALVHLSGGKWIPEPAGFARSPGAERLLDDHVHDVPPEAYDLLAELTSLVDQSLTVVIERDGEYPAFSELLDQVRQARWALARGRRMRTDSAGPRLKGWTHERARS